MRRALIVALLGVAACASEQQVAQPVTAGIPAVALGPSDVFEVRVYDEKELSGVYRVGSDGSINFPLVGRIEVAGLNAGEVSDRIAQRLSKYIKEPSVSTLIKEYNSKKIYVFGEVKKPGTFPFEQGMNVIQAITLAGGFEKLADKNGTFVTRVIDGREQRIEIPVTEIGKGEAPNFSLEPGDIVYIPESLF